MVSPLPCIQKRWPHILPKIDVKTATKNTQLKNPGTTWMQILENSKSWEYNSLCSNSSSSCLIVPINQNLSSGRIGKAASQSLFEVLSKATIGINVILIPPIGSIIIHFIIFFLVQIMILSFLGALHVGPLDPQTHHFDLPHSLPYPYHPYHNHLALD